MSPEKEPVSAPATARPSWFRRLLRWAARCAALAGLLLLALLLTRTLWLPPLIERAVPWVAERFLPFRISVDAVLAADYDRLSVRGLHLEAVAPDESLRKLVAAELDAHLSFPRLFGDDLLRAFHDLRARDAELVLDLARGADEPAEAAPAKPPPQRLPELDLQNTSLDVAFDPGTRATGRVEELLSTDGELVTLRLADLDVLSSALPERVAALRLGARYSAGLFTEVQIAIDDVPRVVDSTVDLRRAAQDRISWQLELRPPGGSMRIEGESAPRGVRLELDARQVRLAPLLALVPDAPRDLAASFDARAKLTIPPAGLLRGRGDLELDASQVSVGGFALDHLAATLNLANGRVAIPSLRAQAGANRLELDDAAVEVAAFETEAFTPQSLLEHARGELQASIDEPARLVAAQNELGAEFLASAKAALTARIARSRFDVSALRLDSPAAHVQLERGSLDWKPDSPPAVDLACTIDVRSLPEALALLGLADSAGRVSGRLTAKGSWPLVEGALSLRGDELALHGIAIGALMLEADYDAQRVRLRSLRTNTEGQSLSASGEWNRDEGSVEGGVLTAEIADLSRVLPGLVEGGRVSLDARAEGPLAELATRFSLRAQDVRRPSSPPIELSVAAQGLGRRVALETVEARVGSLVASGSGGARIRTDASLEELELATLRFVENGAELLVLDRPATVRFEGDGAQVDGLVLAGTLGHLRIDATRSGRTGRLAIEAVDLRPMRILAPFLPEGWALDRLDASVQASLDGSRFALSTDGTLRGFRNPSLAAPAELSWQIEQDAERCRIGGLYASVGDALVLDAFGELPLSPAAAHRVGDGPIDLHVQLDARSIEGVLALDPELPRARGDLSAALDLSGDARRVHGALVASSDALSVAPPEGAASEIGRLDALIVMDEAVVLDHATVKRAEGASPVELTARGALSRPLDLTELLADPGAWASGAPLDLETRIDLADLSKVSDLVAAFGLGSLPLHTGSLAATASMDGTLADPDPRGHVELHDGALRLGPDLPGPNSIEAAAALDAGSVQLERFTGELGGANFQVEGSIRIDSASPRLDLALTGEDLLLHRSRGIKIRGDTDLAIKGPLDALVVSGGIALADSRYVRNFEIDLTRRAGPSSGARGLSLFRLSTPPFSDVHFDVRVTSKEPFEIRNTTVSGAVRPDLRLGGTGEVPVLTGSIYVDPTKLNLPGSSLKIDSGTIQFREEDPFMPVLALRGGTRLRGYDIQVVISGTLAQPEILLSSNPPLPNDELLLLVTTGQVPVEGEAASASETARVLAIYLAKDFLARWLSEESTESEESILDRFEVVTGQDISESGADTIWASFRIAKDVVSDKDKLYLTAERDEYDYFNYGLRIVFRFE